MHHVKYKYTEDERAYYILNAALMELMDMPSSKRWVLQNRILLFALLNGFITKRHFLIMCNRYDIYGELGSQNQSAASHTYFRRFFSRACTNKLFLKVKQRYDNGKTETVYTISAIGRERLKEGICSCELTLVDSLWCSRDELLSSIDLCFRQKKRFRETMHPEHTFGIGDFHAAFANFSLSRFLPEIDIENSVCRNGFEGEYRAVVCENALSAFRADGYAKIPLDGEFVLRDKLLRDKVTHNKECSEIMYVPFNDAHSITVLLEQDTGTQRKDILRQKIRNYSSLYESVGNADKNGVFCLLYSFLNSSYGRTQLRQQMIDAGTLEAEFTRSLLSESCDESDSFAIDNSANSTQDASETELFSSVQTEPTLGTICRATKEDKSTLIELYDSLLGVSCILHNDDIGFLSQLIQRSLLLPHPGQDKIRAWNNLLTTLTAFGIASLHECQELFRSENPPVTGAAVSGSGSLQTARTENSKSKTARDSESSPDASSEDTGITSMCNGILTAKQYGTYHMEMENFLSRRRALEECFLEDLSVRKANLTGHMLVALPAKNLHCLLPFLFVNRNSFLHLCDYLNRMYAGITDLVSFSAVGRTSHGHLLNQHIVNTFNGQRTYYFENLSLDLGAKHRIVQYLYEYSSHPERYENETIVIFFLSDDLDRARSLSLELSLYRHYDSGLLKERAINRTTAMTEVLFICMEDINRGMPALSFDRTGTAHYKAMLHHGSPHLYDVPATANNCSVPVERPF